MRKFPPMITLCRILLSIALVFSLVACTADIPEPQTTKKEPDSSTGAADSTSETGVSDSSETSGTTASSGKSDSEESSSQPQDNTTDGTTGGQSVTTQKTQTTVKTVAVTGITLPTDISLERGVAGRISPVLVPAGATDRKLTFSISDSTVASVDSSGNIVPKKAGHATVTVRSANGVTAQVNITVTVSVRNIKISCSPKTARFLTGQTGILSVSLEPADAGDKTYSLVSRNPAVASVDAQGGFICLSGGSAVFEASTPNGKSASFSLEVIDPAVYSAEVVRLVNVEREKAGLSALTADNADLTDAAMLRAKESVEKFSHTRPDGSSCFTALDEKSISYMMCGENIAMGQTSPSAVVTAWMNSPGHKANILGSFSKIGVGIAMSANGQLYWAQLFIS